MEPSVSINGRRVYFSYFHDALNFPPFCCSSTGHSNFDGWPMGGDLYAIDLGPKLDDPAFPASQLKVSRLTQTNDKYAHAMNPVVAPQPDNDTGGVVYIGAIEVDTEFGRKLLFASNRAQLKSSNPQQTKKNKNFNLFTADIKGQATLTLKNIKQYQYYTTTSALSPNRLRQGVAFSYQAHTEDGRQWHIQQLVGSKWGSVYGYGIGNELAHLGSFCVKTTTGTLAPGDYELAQLDEEQQLAISFQRIAKVAVVLAQDFVHFLLNASRHYFFQLVDQIKLFAPELFDPNYKHRETTLMRLNRRLETGP